MTRLSRFIATGFFSGYFPFDPGTVGSGVGLLIFFLFPILRGTLLLAFIVVGFFIGVWASAEVEKKEGKDPSIVNIDEIVGMWISLIFLPLSLSIPWLVLGFFLFRAFDILKPFPVGKSQDLKGGWGIMTDDLLAALYTNGLMRLLLWIFIR